MEVRGRRRGLALDELIFVATEAPEGGFTARALVDAIFTEADDMAELHERVRDAVRCHFDEGKAPVSSCSTSCAMTSSPYDPATS